MSRKKGNKKSPNHKLPSFKFGLLFCPITKLHTHASKAREVNLNGSVITAAAAELN